MPTIKEILISRDGLNTHEADALIAEARADLLQRLAQGDMPFDICEEYFGLEPDFLMELVPI